MAPQTRRRPRGTSQSRERLVVRRARPKDRDAILSMSERIWGGGDYLPLIWDRWLQDPDGVLLTASLNGRPVGMSKISVLAPGEVWLEGLRLHPDLQGKGLSRQINHATFREAMKLKPRTVRFSTATVNTASRHLGEKSGFWQIARTRWMWGRARMRGALKGRLATRSEFDRVHAFVRNSECYERTGGLLATGWKFPALTGRRLRRLVSSGNVLVHPARGRIAAVAIYDVGPIDNDACLGFADGPDEEISILARDVLRVAGRLGHKDASAMVPEGRIADVVQGAGFDAIHPFHAVVYELGARGARPHDEPIDSVLRRAVRANEDAAADLLTDLLAEHAPGRLARENVRDFVMRNLLPDTEREIATSVQGLVDQLPSFPLRGVFRAIVEHLALTHGLAGSAMKVGKKDLEFRHRGKRLATLTIGSRAVRLALGPGFGPCFPADLKLDVQKAAFPDRTRDPKTGKYAALTLWLSEEGQIPAARKAIDIIMRCAAKSR